MARRNPTPVRLSRRDRRDQAEAEAVRQHVLRAQAEARTGSTTVALKPVEVPRVRNSDPMSRAFAAGSRWLKAHRWQLTPLVSAGVVVWAAATSPAAAAGWLAGLTLAAYLAANHLPETLRGRLWGPLNGRTLLSLRERSTAALWALLAMIWCGAVALTDLVVDRIGVLFLVAALAIPSVTWIRSRRIRPPDLPSERVRQITELWTETVTADGPKSLQGSTIVGIEESQVLVLTVQLFDAHSDDVCKPDIRKYLERTIRFGTVRLGLGTVQTRPDREDSTQVRIILTPDRHLEKVDADWPGPVLHDNGEYDLAVTAEGEVIRGQLYDKDGVKHLVIVGATGEGKSITLGTAILPGVKAGRATVWYADGGGGDSAPWLANACDWWAVTGADEWRGLIISAMDVAIERGRRRAAQGIGSWRGTEETDPILILVFDEATAIARALEKKYHDMVLEIAELGRKRGIAVVQVSQDPAADRWIGGRVARDQMRQGGQIVVHPVGSMTAALLALGSNNDLDDLPDEGKGWAVIQRGKKILAPAARVLNASKEKLLAELDGFAPRRVSTPDAEAAGDAYRLRVRGSDAAARMRGEHVQLEPQGPARTPPPMILRHAEPTEPTDIQKSMNAVAEANRAGAELGRMTAFHTLAHAEGGMTTAAIAEAIGTSERTAHRYMTALQEVEKVSYDVADKCWTTVSEGVSA